jgi:GAF domain-containing protein
VAELAAPDLLREVESLREQQRALAEVLRAVARSDGLAPVLGEVVKAAVTLCEGEYGVVYLAEGEVLRANAYFTAEESDSAIAAGSREQWAVDRQHDYLKDRSTLTGRVALTREVVHLPDMLADPEYTHPLPAGSRAGLGAPILVDDDLIGAIVIVRGLERPFAPEEIELVRTFADQAAVAIKNARSVEALQRRLDQQQAISGVLRAISRSAGLQTVLDEIVDIVTRLGGGDNVRMWLVRDGLLHAVANGGWTDGWEYDKGHPHAIDASSAAGRAALTREPVHIEDVTADPEYTYEGPVTWRANLSVPILLDDELIGVFGIVKEEPKPFAGDQIDLLETFAAQAAVAIANARLIDAVERQLDQQRAIGEVFAVVARSEGLDRVFEAAISAATRLCDGDYGGLYLLEDGVFHAQAYFGAAEQFEYELEHPHPLDRTTLTGRSGLTRETVHIPNLGADPDYDWPLLLGHSAGVAVPILIEDELIGSISISRTPEPFTDEQIELVKTFADQAAIAIANARLIEAVQRQLEQQRAISDVLGGVARAEGLESVLHAVVEAACRLCEAQFGEVYLTEGDVLRIAVGHGGPPELYEYEREHPQPIAGDRTTINGRVLLSRAVVHIPDILDDEDYSLAAATEAGIRALLGAPLMVEGQLVGVFNIVRTEPVPFTDDQMALLGTFADQAAIAVANARLMEAVERQRSELSRFVSPQVAELVSSDEGQKMLAGHRAYVTSMFCDLRGFTSFTELAEPEELFEVLRVYHLTLGELIPRYEGTLEHFAGDGLMVFFNDPVPVEDHELKAVRLALEAQERFDELASGWQKRGHELGLGIGIAAGYATLGRIGFEGRYDYGVLGTVTNLASRLSAQAEPGQTLISQRVYAAVEEEVDAHEVGELELKGFGRPMPAYEVRGLA